MPMRCHPGGDRCERWRYHTTMYNPPKQQRAIDTERRFLEAMDALLTSSSYSKISIEMIASHANLHKGAFLNRFGSKKQALVVLFGQYCEECYCHIDDMIRSVPKTGSNIESIGADISATFEQLLVKHFSANRGMYECFGEDLKVHPLTKGIFKRTVVMMKVIQSHYGITQRRASAQAFAATQILVTVNFNFVMNAMPGLPASQVKRHQLIGKLIAETLAFDA